MGCASNPTIVISNPLLDLDAPALIGKVVVFDEDFDSEPDGVWALSNYGVFAEYEPRYWEWTGGHPTGR